jgi:hypothetical protein
MNSHNLLDKLKSSAAKEDEKIILLKLKLDALNTSFIEGRDDYESKDNKFIAELNEQPQQLIFKLAETCEEFRDYCEDRHPDLWQDYLKQRGYHGEALPTLKGEENTCSNLKQYLGQFLLAEWNTSNSKTDDLQVLDRACEMNTFPALSARCHYNLEILANNLKTLTPSQIEDYENKILADINTIQNQYWAPGYMYSYAIFMRLAQLNDIPNAKDVDISSADIAAKFYLSALECEMMAAVLYSQPTSQQIMQEHDIDKWQTDSGINNLNKAEELVLASMHMTRNHSIFTAVKNKVEKQVGQLNVDQELVAKALRG